MRVTIEVANDGREGITVDRGLLESVGGDALKAGPVMTDKATILTAATDGGSPSEALLSALGGGSLETDDVIGDEVPTPGGSYEGADGTSAGGPPDWLAELLSGNSMS